MILNKSVTHTNDNARTSAIDDPGDRVFSCSRSSAYTRPSMFLLIKYIEGRVCWYHNLIQNDFFAAQKENQILVVGDKSPITSVRIKSPGSSTPDLRSRCLIVSTCSASMREYFELRPESLGK